MVMNVPMFFGILETIVLQIISTCLNLVTLIPIFLYYPLLYVIFDNWEKRLKNIRKDQDLFEVKKTYKSYFWLTHFYIGKIIILFFLAFPMFISRFIRVSYITIKHKNSTPLLVAAIISGIFLGIPIIVLLSAISFVVHLILLALTIINGEMINYGLLFWEKIGEHFGLEKFEFVPSDEINVSQIDKISFVFRILTRVREERIIKVTSKGVSILYLILSFPGEIIFYSILFLVYTPLYVFCLFSFRFKRMYERRLENLINENVHLIDYFNMLNFGIAIRFLRMFEEERSCFGFIQKMLFFCLGVVINFLFLVSNLPIIPFIIICPSIAKIVLCIEEQIKIIESNKANLAINVSLLLLGPIYSIFIALKMEKSCCQKLLLFFISLFFGTLFYPFWWFYFFLSLALNLLYWGGFSQNFASFKLDFSNQANLFF